jgi:hypothetical protein
MTVHVHGAHALATDQHLSARSRSLERGKCTRGPEAALTEDKACARSGRSPKELASIDGHWSFPFSVIRFQFSVFSQHQF